LVGYGRKAIPDDDFRKLASDAIKEFSRRELNNDVWGRIAKNASYVAVATMSAQPSINSRRHR